MDETGGGPGWSEQNSRSFMDYGRYMVPDREAQIDIVARLVPRGDGPFDVLELACGEGLLAQAILDRFPGCTVYGYDGSPEMLRAAERRLAGYGDRFRARQFDLASTEWRKSGFQLRAVVSSLAIHHLDGEQKRELYRDLYEMLGPGGALVIADIVQPAGASGLSLAADEWDKAVRARSLELDGDTRAFDFFSEDHWNIFRYPDPVDKPSGLFEQLRWLEQAGFVEADVYWLKAGHAIYGGRKHDK